MPACSDPDFTTEERETRPSREPERPATFLVGGDRARELLDGGRRELLQRIEESMGGRLEIVLEAQSLSVVTLTGNIPTRGDTLAQRATDFIEIFQVLLDPIVPSKDYVLAPQDPACFENTIVFDRHVDGVPVLGSRLTINFNANHEIESVTNGVAPVPSRVVEVDPWSIEGAKPFEALLPEGYEGHPTRTKVFVPAPDRSGVVAAEAYGWYEFGRDPKEAPRPQAAIVINGVAITGKLKVQTAVSQPPVLSVYAPKYLDKDNVELPEFISYRDIGGAGVNSFPWEHNPAEMAYRFLEEHPSLMRTGAARCQYTPKSVTEDPAIPGVFFVKLQQKYGPLPVFGSELVIMQEGLGKVMSVAGRTLSKIEAATSPQISVTDALDSAANTLLDGVSADPAYKNAVYDALQRPSKVALGVLPAHKQDPSFAQQERLVYEVQRGPYVFYVDTENGKPIGSRQLIAYAQSIVTDAGGANELSWPFIRDEVDGMPTGLISPRNSDNLLSRPGGNTGTSIAAVRSFYDQFSWEGSNGRGADWVANTNVNFMFTPCANAYFDGVITGQTFYCLGEAANDVVGHEFTHGVVYASSGLWFADQSGALNEAYGDIIGNLVSPDQTAGNWEVGELNTSGTSRDMKNPGIGHITGFLERDGTCNLLPWSCDSGFVHANAGIINRAHVLLADGIPDGMGGMLTPGIGRKKMERLMFITMTQRLFSDARLNDAAVATRDVCDMFVARGVGDTASNPYTISDCDQVTTAFNQVGLNGLLDSGWQEPTLGFSGSRVRNGSGETTPNGCAVTNIVGDLQLITGNRSIDLDPTTPMSNTTSDPFGTQTITLRDSGTMPPAPLGTPFTFHIVDWTSIWGHEPRHATRIENAANCAPPVLQIERTSAPFVRNNFFGESGTNFIGTTASSWGPGCTLRDTNVELFDGFGNRLTNPGKSVISPVTHWVFGLPVNYNMTATINFQPTGGPSGNLVAGVTWGYAIGRGPMVLRLRYTIDQAAGATCTP